MRVSRVFNAIFLPTLYYEVDLRNSSVVLASRIAAQSLARSAPYIRRITVDEHLLMVYSKGVIAFKDTEDQDTDKACNNKVEGGLWAAMPLPPMDQLTGLKYMPTSEIG
ncbi:hypothetical protein BGX33_005325 [Mortierella sp. NVP41]|nr:hypothetical protein BGX33_005325 [Mortierella sp. NVP41]